MGAKREKSIVLVPVHGASVLVFGGQILKTRNEKGAGSAGTEFSARENTELKGEFDVGRVNSSDVPFRECKKRRIREEQGDRT